MDAARRRLGGKTVEVPREMRVFYHAACVVASVGHAPRVRYNPGAMTAQYTFVMQDLRKLVPPKRSHSAAAQGGMQASLGNVIKGQGDTEDVLVLVNHSPEKVTAALSTERRVASIADVRGGAPVAVGGPVFSVPLEPSGVAALRIAYA